MRSSRSFRRPTVGVFVAAVVAGAALLSITGVSSTAPPVGAFHVAHSMPGPLAAGSSQTITSLGEPSAQSLDEQSGSGAAVSRGVAAGTAALAPAPTVPGGPFGVPGVMLDAYQRAERTMAQTQPGCHLPWTLLAGIGEIESGHASSGRVDAAGNTLGTILGPSLDGSPGVAAIPATDHGALDGDPVWDHAVGPMQFIPSSWRAYGAGSPNNIYDSTLAAGRYLCAGGADLSDPVQQAVAVYRYNHSADYVSGVLWWAQAYRTGVLPTPLARGPVPEVTNSDGMLTLAAARTPQAPVRAQPAPTQLDAPAAANLDAPVTPTTVSAPQSPDALATPTTAVSASQSLDGPPTG